MRLLRHPLFLSVSLSHFVVDVLNGQTGILLAVMSAPLGLTNAAIGLIAMIYSVLASVSQPLFGWLSDRYGGSWAAAGGVIWMAGFFSLVAIAPGYWPIVFLIIGGLGSAAFHPPGATEAVQVGHRRMAGHAATAMAIFILFGQGGQSLGPAMGGFILDHLGRPGLLILTAMAIPAGIYMAFHFRPAVGSFASRAPEKDVAKDRPTARPDLTVFVLTILLAALRTWAQSVVTTFAPKYFHDQGIRPTIYGAIVAVFMAGSAFGGVFGGMLSDRWSRRRTITLTLALSILPYYFFPMVKGGWIYPVALIAGLFSGAPHSIFISMAQRSLPGRAGLASGIALGAIFTAGSLGSYLSGLAADQIGLARVLQVNALLVLCAAVLSLAVRPDEKRMVTAAVPAGD